MMAHKSMTAKRFYYIGFGLEDLGSAPPKIALLSGDPQRACLIAETYLQDVQLLSETQ
ncbi:hypothetical protein [Cylindrospermum stagnale]|uniref:hypothetical protein n=1 Tax=Cylindrospermum stagnale TaxID=142864 RepID=UPI0026824E6B